MKRSLTISGDDADRLYGAIRALSGEFEVDLVEEPSYSENPMNDIVFFLDRMANHSSRIDRKLSKLSPIESKLSRISLSLEALVVVQRERLDLERERFAFDQKQAQERALVVRK